jgi:hypothetical protein
MKRFELTIIGISIGTTMLISALFGFAGSSIYGAFWGWFTVSFLVQVILFLGWNSYLIQKDTAIQEQAELKALEQYSKFTIKLTCAYCKQPNVVPIQLNVKNTFKCQSCNQANGVFMQFMATTLTTPIENVKIPLVEAEPVELKLSKTS